MRKTRNRDRSNNGKTKALGIFGSLSGSLGIIGLHNVCHLVCSGLIAGLAIFGIIVVGMPLAFLQNYSFIFSITGLASSGIALILFSYYKFSCSMKFSRSQKFWLVLNSVVLVVSIFGVSGNL